MDAKHTPGPWQIGLTVRNSVAIDAILPSPHDDGERCAVAHIVAIPHRQSPETGEANACLIAAAPDLLAALEQALALIEGEGLDELHGDCAEVARGAISRAKGEA